MRKTPVGLAVIAAALLTCPPIVTASLAQGQQPPSTDQQPPTQQPPQAQQPAQTQQPPQTEQQTGSQSGQSAPLTGREQEAVAHLKAAHDALAEIIKLPEAAHLQGEARTEMNALITNFNTLINTRGPEWRQSYDKLQQALSRLIGTENVQTGEVVGTAGQTGTAGQSGVRGQAGTTSQAVAGVDPAISSRLQRVRQELVAFGEAMGLPADAAANGTAGSVPVGTTGSTSEAPGVTGTSGTTANGTMMPEEIRGRLDSIDSIVSQALAQAAASTTAVTVDRAQLERLRQQVEDLRRALNLNQNPSR